MRPDSESDQQAADDGPADTAGDALPAVSVPTGGGAVRGIGEKFSVNPATGTGTLAVPVPVSPGRAGFGPRLTLAYDSGQGNGPFGLGWSLAVPEISRKTSRGVPRYADHDESDVFVVSGAEDLVPLLDAGLTRVRRTEHSGGTEYTVDRYVPRVEGLYARIERWTDGAGDAHWRSISTENVTTIYGRSAESRIADPDPAAVGRTAVWLASASYDDRGNAVLYEYKAEDSAGVLESHAHERNRTAVGRTAQRYLKSIRYGNRTPCVPGEDLRARTDWMFRVVLDHGEHYEEDASGTPVHVSASGEGRDWGIRKDAFSSYRTGFEVRTYRLCRSILMFHRFPDELGAADVLVNATHLAYDESAVAARLVAVTTAGYRRRADGYLKRSLPTLEIAYSEGTFDFDVRGDDAETRADAPAGSHRRSWVDLDGDGAPGVLAEVGDAWLYQRNLSPAGSAVRLAPARPVAVKPAGTGAGRWRWLDVSGDGQLDLVRLDGAGSGVHPREPDGGWARFHTFTDIPNVPWDTAAVTLVDLTGDGRADLLVDGDGLRWYQSAGDRGFDPGGSVPHRHDEDEGPRVVLADPTRSVQFADMSGDGLPDLVRIRNGQVCYWPNLGYGRFGPMVVMGNAPWFDAPDLFDARRVRLADADGSGPVDLLYLGAGAVDVYPNRAGNDWGRPRRVDAVVPADSGTDVEVMDLRGNGTACLVWSTGLPAEQHGRLRYVELTGGVKPNLLVRTDNGLGAVTCIDYASSAEFAVRDDLAGRPWATRLPFPVHVVERVRVEDQVNRTRSTTRYAYHHGFFDGVEREFRGFGLVEQWDTEELAVLGGQDELPAANLDPASHVPPVLTRSWFHTGAFLEGGRLEAAYESEYYQEPGHTTLRRRSLLPKSVVAAASDLSPDELREAVRALKGVLLRKETYGLDGSPAAAHPYTVSEHSYTVERIQRSGPNRFAVLRTHARETVELDYGRFVRKVHGETVADPRVRHQMVFDVDPFGNQLRSADIVYGRRRPDPDLAPADQAAQARPFVTVHESRYTKAVDRATARRAPQLCETRVHEIVNAVPPSALPAPGLLGMDKLRSALDAVRDGAHDLRYEDVDALAATPGKVFRRLVEHTVTLFRRNDLSGPLAFGDLESLALPHETYALALTPSLLSSVYGTRVTDTMLADEGRYVRFDDRPGWWTAGGRGFLSPRPDDTPAQELAYARKHFYLAQRLVDSFGNSSSVRYDKHDLLPLETVDALGNRMTAGDRDADGNVVPALDYRTLQPALVTDFNRNRTAMAYDALGRLAAIAVTGKAEAPSGDSLGGVAEDLDQDALDRFAADPVGSAAGLLGSATRRTVYDLTRFRTHGEPALSAVLAREQRGPDAPDRTQITVSHADGSGRVAQQKVRVAPGPVAEGGPSVSPRWVGSAWTVVNNKGQPVRTYEPFFGATHRFEFARVQGVSDVLFRDPAGRVVARLRPDHAYEKTVVTPWRQEYWNAGDTVLTADPRTDPDVGAWFARIPADDFLPGWHAARIGGARGPEDQDAAAKAAAHADTPSCSHYDALGRPFLVVETTADETVETRARFDIEGNTRAVTDALDRVAVRTDFDLQGRALRRTCADTGQRHHLPDAGGRTLRAWTPNGAALRSVYDELHRPTDLFVAEGDGPERLVERFVYGEDQGDAGNHRGRLFRQFDAAGVTTCEAYDASGNVLRLSLRLPTAVERDPDWSGHVPMGPDEFVTTTRYDALNRPVRIETADGTVTRLRYDDGGLLARSEANVRGEADATVFLASVRQNARGEPVFVEHGNGVTTTYTYDARTFALNGIKTVRGATVLQDIGYTRDAVGNVTTRRDAAQQTVFFANTAVTPDADYTYDALQRLVRARGREHVGQGVQVPAYEPRDAPRVGLAHPQDGQAMRRYTQTYAYDKVGNLQRVAHQAPQGSWTRRYQYEDNSNRLQSTSLPGDPDTGTLPNRYAHDTGGNMLTMPHLARMDWDARDRLRTVDLGGGGTAHYVYDVSGARARKVVLRQNGTRLREHLYLGTLEIQREFAGDGATVTWERQTFVAGTGGMARVETRTQGTDPGAAQVTRFQMPDALGSVALELDGAGDIIAFEEYYPYGATSYQAVRRQTEVPKSRRHSGKERDEETGFAHQGMRYYAPWLGRWTSADPAGMVDGPNLYAYVRGNPVNAVDPSGTELLQSHEGMYAHTVTYKSFTEYAASAAADGVSNEDGTVTATLWSKTPPATVTPHKPAPKPAPAKPRRKPAAAAAAEAPPALSAHDLTRLARGLLPKLVYPKPVRQFFGALKLLGGLLEAGGGATAAVGTAETVAGAVAGAAVAAHGIDNAASGWDQMTTGEESPTWTFMAGAGYASMVTDDPELQAAVGSGTETVANLGSAAYGLHAAGSVPGPRLAVPGAVADSEGLIGARGVMQPVNTGVGRAAETNCVMCTVAGADAVPLTSTEQAAAAGVPEGGYTGGPGGFSAKAMGKFLANRGLGSGTPDVAGATPTQAESFMAGFPEGTKFAVSWTGKPPAPGIPAGHAVNARVGRFGLYFIDNQAGLGAYRPFFRIPPGARDVNVWTTYNPNW